MLLFLKGRLPYQPLKMFEKGFLGVLLLVLLPLQGYSECSIPAIFNFGDSTSDTGNIHFSFPYKTLAEKAPYGQTFFHKPVNRYGDGRLLIDFIAQGLGKPFLSPYLQSVDSNFSGGANFASSGATASDVTFISPFTFTVQANEFAIFKQQVLRTIATKGQRSELPTPEAFNKGLYIIQIGGNDFSYGYMILNLSVRDMIRTWLPKVATAVAGGIRELYRQGARNFWVLDVNPQGCLPFALSKYPHTQADLDSNGCAEPYNRAARFYNRLLKDEVQILQNEMHDAKVVFVNTYDIQYDLVRKARSYGFNYTTRACCGVGGEYNFNWGVQCASSNTINGQFLTALACANPSEYVSWDGIHLTDRANHIMARKILTGDYFFPAFPIGSLCQIQLH